MVGGDETSKHGLDLMNRKQTVEGEKTLVQEDKGEREWVGVHYDEWKQNAKW